jgi:hypothetical protein
MLNITGDGLYSEIEALRFLTSEWEIKKIRVNEGEAAVMEAIRIHDEELNQLRATKDLIMLDSVSILKNVRDLHAMMNVRFAVNLI